MPDIAPVTLSNLQSISPARINVSATEAFSLPPASKLDLECKFDHHPHIWRQALSEGYLPWLWDLDPAAIAQKEASKPHGQEWNWELFVRQLAQINLYEPRAILVDLPMGLRNRRRIWRIIMNMLSEEVDSYYDSQGHR